MPSPTPLFASKRDLWLCLARAFAPPIRGAFHQAFTQALPSDLADIATEIGLAAADEIALFASEAARMADDLEIQRLYSSLFSTPPAPVFINTAIYLDGAFLGESELGIQRWCERYGFERDPNLKDLNDHVAVQLEFVGQLYHLALAKAQMGEDMEANALASDAERFIRVYPSRWIGPFLLSLQTACADRNLNRAYIHLAHLLRLAIEHETCHAALPFQRSFDASLTQDPARGAVQVSADDLAQIALRLVTAGLSMDHVRRQPGWSEDAFLESQARSRKAECNT